MKSFFDNLSKIGEILAPVAGTSSSFFLAIQSHNNSDVQSMLSSGQDTDMARAQENGYSAIHCASRFNNLFAVDLIMSRGVAVDLIDQQGNTPLHYAAKYGHLDLCRTLIERGAFAGKKNDQGQTAYDTAGSHTVRQYLLPLHFQSERKHSLGSSPYIDNYGQMPGQMARSSSIPVSTQSNQYAGEQQHMSYSPATQYNIEQQLNTQYTQEQPMYPPTVHIPHASSAPGTSNSALPSPSIPMKNAPLNLPINVFSRNDSGNEKRLSSRLTTSTSSGMNSPRDTAANSAVTSPAKPTNGIQVNPFAPPANHNGPTVQNHNPPIFTANSQSIRNNAAKVQVFSGSAAPIQQTQQVPPAQLVPPNPHLQVPQQSPHKAAPHQSHHQPIPQVSYAAQPVYSSGPPPALPPQPAQSQAPSVMQPAYKPSPVINSTNRIILPDGFHTSASDPELQKKYGHTRNIIDIAPPPIFNNGVVSTPPAYGMYNSQPPQQSSDFNQLVPPQAYGGYLRNDQKHQ